MSLALSHHYPDQLDRCVVVAGHHICRRCLWLYPSALLVAAISSWTSAWNADLDPAVLMLLPLPVTVEWWFEHLNRARYNALRQVLFTLLAAVALGRGFARYLENQTDAWFWTMVVLYGGACALVAGWRFLDDHAV